MKHFPIFLILLACVTAGAESTKLCMHLFQPMNTDASHIFESPEKLQIKLKSNFTHIQISSENDQLSNINMKKIYQATLTWPNQAEVALKAKAFGDSASNSDEATFRKLNLRFADGKEIFINTHVQTHPKEKWTPQGRITDGTSPFREALAYDLAKILRVETPAYRRALIEYTNVDDGEVFTKPALIIENFKDTALRKNTNLFSEKALDVIRSNTPIGTENFSIKEGLRVHLFQILIGNSDFMLELYNTRIFSNSIPYFPVKNIAITQEKKNGPLKPLAYDFDVASIVAGYEQSEPSKPWNPLPVITSDPVTASMVRNILRLRMIAKEVDLELAYAHFRSHQQELLKIISEADVDENGRRLALDHVVHFFKALELAYSKDIKFVKSVKQRIYPAAKEYGSLLKSEKIPPWFERTRPLNMPQGAPVVVLGEEGDFYKVFFIDTHYLLKDYRNNIGYIKKNSLD